MHKLAVLKFSGGNFEQGFALTLQLGRDGDHPSTATVAELPPAPEIPQQYQHWQRTYHRLGGPIRLGAPQQQQTNINWLAECQRAAQDLQHGLNHWLCAESFRPIREKLLEQLLPSDQIRVLVQTDDRLLQKLPWHLWELWDRYPLTEVALSAPAYTGTAVVVQPKSQVNILAILGSSDGINTEADRVLLEQLPEAQTLLLVEPDRRTLTDQLWAASWDILFFAGHSATPSEAQSGHICLNSKETLGIEDLRYALKNAVNRGLKLAIFNSCDGLGLAYALADLQIPQLIVMREPVPDLVAQAFLQYFLQAFSEGQSLYLAVREARERLQGLEDHFPCATWLPVICQHPAELPPTWQDLCYGRRAQPSQNRVATADPLVTMVFTDLCSSTALKYHLSGPELAARNRTYFETILQPHRQRVESTLADHGGRVVKTEGDAFSLVFGSAAQAVQWSVRLQQSHSQDPIPTPLGPLQVRIGMHTGSPLADAEDFIGQDVDYAAHLSDLANGNQILLSEVTAVLLRHAGLTEVTLHLKGEHPLKGIGPVPIFEVLWDHHPPQPIRDKRVGPEASTDSKLPPQTVLTPAYVTPALSDPDPLPSRRLRWQWFSLSLLVTSLFVSAGVMGLRWLGLLQPLELWAFDQLLRLRSPESADSRLLVVTVTEADLQAQGEAARRSSVSDQALSQLLNQLDQYQPRVIGLDIYRDFPASASLPGLAQQLRDHDRLIAVCKGRDPHSDPTGIAPPPELSPAQLGFTDFLEDSDGVLRRQLLYMSPDPVSRCTARYSFSAVLAFQYLSHHQISPQFTPENELQLGQTIFAPLQPRLGGYQGIDSGGIQILLNYRSLPSPQAIAPQVTLAQILSGQVNPETIKNKVVLIGVTANSTGDYWATPYGAGGAAKTPGVFIQAQMVSQLLSAVLDQRSQLWAWPQWVDALWVWAWSLIGGLIAWRLRLTKLLSIGVGGAIVVLTVGCLFALMQGGWLALVPAAFALMLTAAKVVYTESRS